MPMSGFMMKKNYVVADVFTDTPFRGNPVAVVLDARGVTTEQMQQIAIEFGYSETTFVLPPENPGHTARVRIFTPAREIPFAGHPNVGTAFVLAQQAARQSQTLPETLLFEEIAGVVPVRLLRETERVIGAELCAPQALSCYSRVSVQAVAACLSLAPEDIATDTHSPQVASVGLPFLVVELGSREALRRCVPNLQAFRATLPLDGAVSIYAYTREIGPGEKGDLQARMFTSRMTEDPATGSATAAATALLATLSARSSLSLNVSQGVDMGRDSQLYAHWDASGVRVGGQCVMVMEGVLNIA